MKKEGILLIVLILYTSLILVVFGNIFIKYGQDISSGKVTSNPINLSISVISGSPPNIFIYRPVNFTYNFNQSIELRYYVFGGNPPIISRRWYNLDNGVNITLNGDYVNFSIGEGNHIIRVYANNTLGAVNDSESVSFSVNNSFRYNVSYSQYSGNTTNLNSMTRWQMQNITNFTLEKPSFGMIKFLENINISQDDINLDLFTEIRSNYLVINSSYVSFLNKSALLSLYGLAYTNPRILIDEEVCPNSICNKISYSDGSLVFNVTHFSAYSSEETPGSSGDSGSGGSSGGGGGGGGGGGSGSSGAAIVKRDSFILNIDVIKVSLRQNENVKEFIKIFNNEKKNIDLEIDLSDLKEFVTFINGESKLSLKLKPNEEKLIQLIFSASTGTEPYAYNRKIIITGGDIEKEIPVIIEVESENPLFDSTITISGENRVVAPGGTLSAEITLLNLKNLKDLVDVRIDYQIKSLDDIIILSEHETRGLEREVSYLKKFYIPEDLKPGEYVLYVKVSYNNIVGSSTHLFTVKRGTRYPEGFVNYLTYAAILMFMLAVLIFIFIYLKHIKKETIKFKKHVDEHELADAGYIKKSSNITDKRIIKLRFELKKLDKVFDQGVISETSYRKTRDSLLNRINKIKGGEKH